MHYSIQHKAMIHYHMGMLHARTCMGDALIIVLFAELSCDRVDPSGFTHNSFI